MPKHFLALSVSYADRADVHSVRSNGRSTPSVTLPDTRYRTCAAGKLPSHLRDRVDDAARRISNVLWNDPATGVMRHADAGYDIALDCALEHGLRLPGILGN
jgi:hypothetical protein